MIFLKKKFLIPLMFVLFFISIFFSIFASDLYAENTNIKHSIAVIDDSFSFQIANANINSATNTIEEVNHFAKTIEIILAIAIPFFAILFMGISLILFGKGARADFEGEYYRELPSDFNPRKLGLFLRNKVNEGDLMASILDLARLDYIKIEEFKKNKQVYSKDAKSLGYRLFRTDKKDGLEEAEQFLLDYLFSFGKTDVLSEFTISSVSLEDIENYVLKKRSYFSKFWYKWIKIIKKNDNINDYINKKYLKVRTIIWISYALFIITGLGLTFYFQKYILLSSFVLLSIISYFIMVYSALFIRAFNQEGADLFAKWQAFVHYMSDFSNVQWLDLPELKIWEKYLVYASQFGISEKVLKQINSVYPNLKEADYTFANNWFIAADGNDPNYKSLTNMINSLSSLIHICVSTATRTPTKLDEENNS